MKKALEMIYADILEFHRRALRVFTSSSESGYIMFFSFFLLAKMLHVVTKQFFRSMWKDFNTRFQQILEDLRRHQNLIESLASASHIQQYQMDRENNRTHFDRLQKTEMENKYIDVTKWIAAADSSVDYNFGLATRREYPQSGRWILDSVDYSNWKEADVPRKSMIWMHGIPGAGMSFCNRDLLEAKLTK
jgi:hypothetical protein